MWLGVLYLVNIFIDSQCGGVQVVLVVGGSQLWGSLEEEWI